MVGGIKQGVRATGLAPRGLEGSLLGTSKISHGLEYEAPQAYAPGLVPYAGVAKKAMPPSPIKPPQVQEEVFSGFGNMHAAPIIASVRVTAAKYFRCHSQPTMLELLAF